jgi:GAF domain-containing protein
MAEMSNATAREVRLGEIFLRLADTLVSGFDLDEVLQMLVEETHALLPVDDVALFLVGKDGVLRVVAATSSKSRSVETLVLEVEDGPCLDAYRYGQAAGVRDIDELGDKWAAFATIARAGGFRASHALPMNLRGETIGALNLFSDYPYSPSETDAAVAQALAHAATIAIIQHRTSVEQVQLSTQLQGALESRVLIEQAKGVVAQVHQITVAEAFSRLRAHARQNGLPLRDVAQRIVERSLVL